jgi:hypothetical protein
MHAGSKGSRLEFSSALTSMGPSGTITQISEYSPPITKLHAQLEAIILTKGGLLLDFLRFEPPLSSRMKFTVFDAVLKRALGAKKDVDS